MNGFVTTHLPASLLLKVGYLTDYCRYTGKSFANLRCFLENL